MDTQVFQVTTSYQPRKALWLQGYSPEELQDKLIVKGYKYLFLNGLIIEDFSEGVYLFVDNEITHLLNDYMYLEELLLLGDQYEHGSYLGDGELSISSESDGETAKVRFEYCLSLDIANLLTYDSVISTNAYVYWWRSIVQEIVDFATVT